MKGTVNFFRRTFVEGRFIPSLGVLGFLLMRTLLFLYADPFRSALPPTDNHLWSPLSGWFIDPLISFLVSTVSIFAIAWVLSSMNSRFNLVRARSYLPFVAPLFLFSLHPCFLVMSGDYVAILFILFAFFPLLESYQQPDSYLYFSFRRIDWAGLALSGVRVVAPAFVVEWRTIDAGWAVQVIYRFALRALAGIRNAILRLFLYG